MASRMPADVETALIARAQAGDDSAVADLLAAYLPAINAAARAWARLVPSREDALQAGAEGVLMALRAYTPARGPRLAGIVRNHIQDAMWAVASGTIGAMNVPRSVLVRYFR